MIGAKRRSNPLNLMRVMPPKEARLGHAIFCAWLFCCESNNSINLESKTPGEDPVLFHGFLVF
jgi:hypothetical protein